MDLAKRSADKPYSYEKIYHCKDCVFMWALGALRNVCTIGIIKNLPRHPHDAINFESNEDIYEYDSKVRELTDGSDCDVDCYNGTCDMNTLR